MFGLSDKEHEWFRSYMEQLSQRECAHGIYQLLLSGVPPSSVLGALVSLSIPVLLGSLSSDMGLNLSSSLKNLEHCVGNIRL
jgi:hypothetical protein